jgi:hypothetical protein
LVYYQSYPGFASESLPYTIRAHSAEFNTHHISHRDLACKVSIGATIPGHGQAHSRAEIFPASLKQYAVF